MMKASEIAIRSMKHVRISAPLRSRLSTANTRFFSSEATAAKETSDQNEDSSSSMSSVWFWGTSNKGTIPTKEVLAAGRGEGDKKDETIVNPFSNKSVIIDTPTAIDVQDTLAIGTLFLTVDPLVTF